jgi:hypothetical protein
MPRKRSVADTLVVAMPQKTPVAAQIVLAEAIGVTIVRHDPRVLLLPMKRSVLGLDDWLVADNKRLAGFVGVVPRALLALGSGLVWRLA